MYDYYLHFTWILNLFNFFIHFSHLHSVDMASTNHSFIQQTYPKHHAYNFVQSKPLWFQEVLLRVPNALPTWPVCNPETTHSVLSTQGVHSFHPCLPCCDKHLIPIVSNRLPSFSSPADYAPTPFQTSKLRFAHNCSDNSPRIRGRNGVHLNELHNCSLKCFSSAAILYEIPLSNSFSTYLPSIKAAGFTPPAWDTENECCVSQEPPFIMVILFICHFQNEDQLRLHKALWLQKHHMTATGSFQRLVCFSYPKTSWKWLKLNNPFLIS